MINSVNGFIVGLATSIIGTIIVLAGTAFLSSKVRRALTAIAAAFLKVDIKYVYSNSVEAADDIKAALKRARRVRVFTGRGNEFQRDLFLQAFDGTNGRRPRVEILLPNPHPKGSGTDWVSYREHELAKFDLGFGHDALRRQIDHNLQFMRPRINDKLEVRLYDVPHIGRIILTEDFLFLTPYKDHLHGRDSAVHQYGRGDVYDMFERFFEMVWGASEGTSLEPLEESSTVMSSSDR